MLSYYRRHACTQKTERPWIRHSYKLHVENRKSKRETIDEHHVKLLGLTTSLLGSLVTSPIPFSKLSMDVESIPNHWQFYHALATLNFLNLFICSWVMPWVRRIIELSLIPFVHGKRLTLDAFSKWESILSGRWGNRGWKLPYRPSLFRIHW